jgi:hypothetical protein
MTTYTKTYGIIERVIYIGRRQSFNYPLVREFTQEQWSENQRQHQKRQYYLLHAILRIRLDNGETLEIDAFGYTGKKWYRVKPGKRVKLYSRPQDRRKWVYKLTGE